MSRPTCDCPVDLAPGVVERCDRPATCETQDLGEIHHLCDACCHEALRWNAFRVDEVGA